VRHGRAARNPPTPADYGAPDGERVRALRTARLQHVLIELNHDSQAANATSPRLRGEVAARQRVNARLRRAMGGG